MKVLFTGIQPTGDIHLGNYFGAIANWVRLQHEYISYISVVDLHAITIPYEAAEMPGRVMDLATTLYACGIDMEKTRLFVQSEVPGHADLTWIGTSGSVLRPRGHSTRCASPTGTGSMIIRAG